MGKLVIFFLGLCIPVVFMVYVIFNPPTRQELLTHTTWVQPAQQGKTIASETPKVDLPTTSSNTTTLAQTGLSKTGTTITQENDAKKHKTETVETHQALFTLDVHFAQRGEGTYELQGTIHSNQVISKVSVESCNSSRDANKLDNEPYTLRSVKKGSQSDGYSFYYKIGPKQQNICNIPYRIKIYGNRGELISESFHHFTQ